MKNKTLSVVGALFGLAILFSACSDDKSSAPSAVSEDPGIIAPDATSSSSAGAEPQSSESNESSSSVVSALAESSSSELEVSSSASSSSSVSEVLRVPEGGSFRWVGAEDGARIITGLDNGSETSGYWFEYTDAADEGSSSIQWPVEVDWDDRDYLEPVVVSCQGLCGTFSLDKGTSEYMTYDPFVALGFDIAGYKDNMSEAEPADISAWGGLCVAYSSTNDIELLLSYGSEFDSNVGYDLPSVILAKSAEGSVKCIRWSQFGIGWGGSVDMEELVKKAVSVKFKIQGKSGTEGKFNIMSVGSYVEQ